MILLVRFLARSITPNRAGAGIFPTMRPRRSKNASGLKKGLTSPLRCGIIKLSKGKRGKYYGTYYG